MLFHDSVKEISHAPLNKLLFEQPITLSYFELVRSGNVTLFIPVGRFGLQYYSEFTCFFQRYSFPFLFFPMINSPGQDQT